MNLHVGGPFFHIIKKQIGKLKTRFKDLISIPVLIFEKIKLWNECLVRDHLLFCNNSLSFHGFVIVIHGTNPSS